MAKIIKLDGKEYEIEVLSDNSKSALAALEFSAARIKELQNLQALMIRAKNSYMDSLKAEVLRNKAGFFLEED